MKLKMAVMFVGAGIIFWLAGYKLIDPDFGWHLRMGEIITNSGIPGTDPFSYTMPSYPFVDYEWLTNLIWHLVYPKIGMAGLAVIYAIAAVSAVWIAIPSWGKKYSVLILLLAASVMLARFGVRPQVINWLFWAIIVRGMFESELWKKWRWLYPLLMLLWVNLHGSYPLGIMAVGLWLGLNTLQERKIIWKDWTVWGLGLAATFVNPYGWRDWAEVILVMQQSALLRSGVQEWAPFYNKFEPGLLMALVVVGFYGWRFRSKWKWWEIMLALWMGWWAVSGLRYSPLFMLFAAPLVIGFFSELNNLAGNSGEGKRRFDVIYKIFICLAVFVMAQTIVFDLWSRVNFKEELWYPKVAVGYLKSHGYKEKIFSDYGWGGYLIWKMPGERFFVDGRMSCFKWKAPAGESSQAFEDYMKIIRDKGELSRAINKYGIGTVLWPKYAHATGDAVEEVNLWFSRKLGLKGEMRANEFYRRFIGWVEELGWNKVYEDSLAVVYSRP